MKNWTEMSGYCCSWQQKTAKCLSFMLENLGAHFFILPGGRYHCMIHEEQLIQEIITLTAIFLTQNQRFQFWLNIIFSGFQDIKI